MAECMKAQVDFILLLCGLALATLATICLALRKGESLRLPWIWLALFGLAGAAAEWLDVVVLSFSESQAFKAVHACAMVLSFVCLVEFGRAGMLAAAGKGVRRWALIPLLIIAGLGATAGWQGVEVTSRYALGLVGGLCAAAALFLESANWTGRARGALVSAGAAIALHALTTVAAAPKTSISLAASINQDAFFQAMGFPVHLLRACFAGWAAAAMWTYLLTTRLVKADRRAYGIQSRIGPWAAATVLGLLVFGWVATTIAGENADKQFRSRLLFQALSSTSVVSPARVLGLMGSPADLEGYDYEWLRHRLSAARESQGSQFVHLIGLRDGEVVFLADDKPASPGKDPAPGDPYPHASGELLAVLRHGEPLVEGPVTDSRGTWVAGLAPVRDLSTSRTIAVLRVGVDADDWLSYTARHRLIFILITCLVCTLAVAFFAILQGSREFGARIASSERRYRSLVDGSPNWVTLLDRVGRCVTINRPGLATMGWNEDDVVGKRFRDVWPEEVRPTVNDAVRRALHGEQSSFEADCVHPDGRLITWHAVLNPIADDVGEVRHIVGISRDITERKQAEQALRRSETFLQNMFDGIQDGISVQDADLNILRVNRTMERWNSHQLPLIGRKCYEAYAQRAEPCENCQAIRAMKEKTQQTEIRSVEGENGVEEWQEVHTFPLIGDDGEAWGIVEHVRNITERKYAEDELQYRVEFDTLITDISTDFINLRPEEFDRGLNNALKTVGEFMGADRSYVFLISDDQAEVHNTHEWCTEGIPPTIQNLQDLVADRFPWIREKLLNLEGVRIPDVAELPPEAEAERELFESGSVKSAVVVPMIYRGSPVGLLGFDSVREKKLWSDDTVRFLKIVGEIFVNALESKRAAEALGEREQTIRAFVETSRDWIWSIDVHGVHTYCNPAVEAILGYPVEELVGKQSLDLMHEDDRRMVEAKLPEWIPKKSGWNNLLIRWRHKDGSYRHLESNAVPILDAEGELVGFRGVDRDVTERTQAEEALERERQLLSLLLNNSPDHIYFKDTESRFIRISKALADWFGIGDPDEALAKTDFDFFTDEHAKEAYSDEQNVMETGRPIVGKEEKEVWPDGRETWVSTSKTPIIDRNGQVVGTFGVSRDITEHKKAEQALQQRQREVTTLLDSLPGYAFFKDANSVYVIANKKFSNALGYEPSEIIGKTDYDIFPKDLAERYRADDARLLELGEPLHVGDEEMIEGDSRVIVATHKVPLKNEEGDVVGLIGLGIDVTEQKQTEQALRESEARYRRLVEALPVILYSAEADTNRFLLIDGAVEQMLGRRPEEFYADPELNRRVVHPDDQARVGAAYEKGLSSMKPFEVEHRIVHAIDGRTVWVHARVVPEAGEDGKLLYQHAVIVDITERKQAEGALRESEEKFRALANTTSSGVVMFREQHFTYANPAAEKITGYSHDELLKMKFWDFIHPDYRDMVRDNALARLRGEAVPAHYEFKIITKSGEERWVLASAAEMAAEGKPTIVATLIDITDRKESEEQLRRLNEELEQRVASRTVQLEAANRELEAFSYSVSHDLRAPLRSIDGFSHALLEDYAGQLDAQGTDYLQRVRSASQRMADLIDDLLNLSRVTRAEMHMEKVDLGALGRAIAAELKRVEPERKVDFVIAPKLVVKGDPQLLRVMLENILDNAWKFTEKHPHARIELGVTKRDGKKTYFVRDDGAGFDMAYVDKLFSPFQRLHSLSDFPGTGIGLATVQRIVRRHGGQVWAEGEVEKGATFYFTV